MINLNGTDYRLCLLDTMAVSEWVKNGDAFGRFLSWMLDAPPIFVPCLSVFSVVELRRSPSVFHRFVELFDVVPWMMLKGYDQLQDEEISLYPDPSSIDPTLLGFTALGDEGNLTRNLPAILDSPELLERERYWNQGQRDVLDGVLSLVKHYPPDGSKYTPREIRTFLEMVVFTQIAERDPAFARSIHENEEAVQIDAFPAFKAMAYTVFHKFYVDTTRKAAPSDVFDFIIAAVTPYVDAIVTEAHQAEVLRKVKRLDSFVAELQVMTIRDFR